MPLGFTAEHTGRHCSEASFSLWSEDQESRYLDSQKARHPSTSSVWNAFSYCSISNRFSFSMSWWFEELFLGDPVTSNRLKTSEVWTDFLQKGHLCGEEQLLFSLWTGLVITLSLQASWILAWPACGPHGEEILFFQGYLWPEMMIRWEINFRADLEDLHRVLGNVKAPLTLPLLFDSRGEAEFSWWSPTGNKLFIMTTRYFKEIIAIIIIIYWYAMQQFYSKQWLADWWNVFINHKMGGPVTY